MQFVSVLLMGLLAATAVLAGPGSAPARAEGDAEVVGRGTKSEGSEGSEGGIRTGDGVYAYIPGLRDFGSLRNFFNRIFGLGRRDETQGTNEGDSSEGGASHGGESDSSNRESARGLLGFGDLFGFNSFIPVFRAKAYNVTYTNSSLEVVKYGGVPMVVNRTIEERKAEDGSVYFSVVSTLVGPYNSTEVDETDGGYTTEVSSATEDDLELVKEQPSTKLKHTLTKRWIVSWLRNKLAKRENRETETSENDLTPHNDGNTNTLEKEKEEKEREEERPTGNSITYIGDTDVNFIPSPLRALNPDAEVFDPTLMREADIELFERRFEHSEPLRSQPMRFEPLNSQPLPSQPLRMHPLRYHPSGIEHLSSQPRRIQPLSSQPLRTRPLSSHPIRSEPIVNQPIRSQPLRYQPLVYRTFREGYRRV